MASENRPTLLSSVLYSVLLYCRTLPRVILDVHKQDTLCCWIALLVTATARLDGHNGEDIAMSRHGALPHDCLTLLTQLTLCRPWLASQSLLSGRWHESPSHRPSHRQRHRHSYCTKSRAESPPSECSVKRRV